MVWSAGSVKSRKEINYCLRNTQHHLSLVLVRSTCIQPCSVPHLYNAGLFFNWRQHIVFHDGVSEVGGTSSTILSEKSQWNYGFSANTSFKLVITSLAYRS